MAPTNFQSAASDFISSEGLSSKNKLFAGPTADQAVPHPKPLAIQYGLDISAIYAAGLARALNHSRALRFARVKVAEIQLYQASQVKSGRAARDLYGALGPHIDAARKAFRDRFLIPLNGVPDYLHQELVKTLANEDAVLLGPSYPGPLA